MIGYLITQINAQITDVIKQIQVHGDIGQAVELLVVPTVLGLSIIKVCYGPMA